MMSHDRRIPTPCKIAALFRDNSNIEYISPVLRRQIFFLGFLVIVFLRNFMYLIIHPRLEKISPPKIVWESSLNPPKSPSRTPFSQILAKAAREQIHPTSACCGARPPPRSPRRYGGVCSRCRHCSTRCSRKPRSSASTASRASPWSATSSTCPPQPSRAPRDQGCAPWTPPKPSC